MAHADGNEQTGADEPAAAEDEPAAEICIAESCPGRTVFSEADNPDGWIGTDLTIDVER